MSFIIVLLMNIPQASAYESGNAPFCVMDNYGNLDCFYYDLGSCQQAAKQKFGPATCIKK